MSNKRILVIGGATLDNIITYEEMETMVHKRREGETSYLLLEEGAKIEVTEQCSFSGGGATNTAVSFQRLGFDATLFCKIGQDNAGQFLMDELSQFGVDTSLVARSNQVGTASSFVVPSLQGDRTVFAYRGANATIMPDELPLDAIAEYDLIYITSLSKQSAECLPDIVSTAKQHQVPVAINPGISQLKLGGGFLKDALDGIEILLLNYEEAQQFMQSLMKLDKADQYSGGAMLDVAEQVTPTFNLKHFFREVMALGPSIVVVTNGQEGVYVATEDRLYFHGGLDVEVVNTLGAGDSFSSSFVGALQLDVDVCDAMRWGVINSASVIQHPDAKTGLLSKDAILQQMTKLSKQACRIKPWEAS